MLLKILIKIPDTNLVGTHHLFVDIRQTEAAFLERHLVAKSLKKLGVDENLLKVAV